MNSPSAHPLIDEATLTTVVCHILDSKTATLGEWHSEAIAHHIINNVTAGLQRISGIANNGSEQLSWSVILKILHLQPENAGSIFNSSQDPTHWNYWQREALIYTSGMLDNLTGEYEAPVASGLQSHLLMSSGCGWRIFRVVLAALGLWSALV